VHEVVGRIIRSFKFSVVAVFGEISREPTFHIPIEELAMKKLGGK
jgi:hypothetical protein